ncbi:LytR family transcriptional attenuator [Stackebrandtia endophytica]|uniref:LytR family transcriptional attenuator n=1 Tax=Stackebrandtia endophytica TaxID=1496996 RepID=A0A543AYU5_9ACTN|nr:LCP family protein [Stackebrandtia endophytica]TQL77747.1 LytR family transcriptional attenuator [Stackebrandtia endophytica]
MKKQGARRALSTRSPWWAKTMLGVGAFITLVAGTTVVYANVLLDTVSDSVETADLLGDGDEDTGNPIEGPLNLLIVGTDLRVNDSDGQDRTDTIMILHINKNLDKASIVSIPRDLKVEIQDCGQLFSSPCTYKINSAYNAGLDQWTREEKFKNLADTVSDLTGIEKFDGAVIMGFEGFLNAVKTFGGIELCLPIDMVLEQQRLEALKKGEEVRMFPKGCNDYNAQEALWIVRERYAYDPANPDFDPSYGVSDYGRQHMQQHFIKQLLKKATEEGYTTDPTKVSTLIQDVGSSLVIDPIEGKPITDMAVALRNVKPSSIETVRLPTTGSKEYFTGVEEDYETVLPGSEEEQIMTELFAALNNDTMDDWIKDNKDLINSDD